MPHRPKTVRTALAVLTAVLVSPLCGKLLDRGPRRPLILLGCVSSGLAALPYVAVTELGPLIELLARRVCPRRPKRILEP